MTDCFFEDGALSKNEPYEITERISKTIGAKAIFEGKVREDLIDGQKVKAIEFSTEKEIAKAETFSLLNTIKLKHQLTNARVYHSIGKINTGEVCFRVVVESAHRKEAFLALPEIVDEFKARVPVFGKEILEDGSYVWKQNR